MKFVLILYIMIGGQPVEVSRTSPANHLATKPLCELAGEIARGRILNIRPDLAGRIIVKCDPII